VLILHPAITEAAVVPVPDPVRRPQGLHRTRAGTRARPRDRVRDPPARAGQPRPFLRVRKTEFYELPKTISGNIRRVELRQPEVELSPSSGSQTDYAASDFPELRG
jgi:acetyl-CoA synthetase